MSTIARTDNLIATAYNSSRLLRTTFTVVPIVAGIDKFTNVLTDWTIYLAPFFPNLLGVEGRTFMYGVGAIEIFVGVMVAVKPKIFAPILGVWMLAIVTNLLILGGYLDIALRDLGLAMGAFTLGRLAAQVDEIERSDIHSPLNPIEEENTLTDYDRVA